MDVSAAGLAEPFAVMRAAATQQALAATMLRQQTQADQSIVALLAQSTEASKAPAPAPSGQGLHVDIRI